MNRTDQVIPRMPRRQIPNPILHAGNKIHFQRQLDGELGMVLTRLLHVFHVMVQVPLVHVPIVKIIPWHRVVLGKPDLGDPQPDRFRRILGRVANRMMAERGVHVIIGRQSHGRKVRAQPDQHQGDF